MRKASIARSVACSSSRSALLGSCAVIFLAPLSTGVKINILSQADPPSPPPGSEAQCLENNLNAECPYFLMYISKNEIRGAHTFAGLESLTALNSRRSVLRERSGGWEPTDLEKPIFLPWTLWGKRTGRKRPSKPEACQGQGAGGGRAPRRIKYKNTF